MTGTIQPDPLAAFRLDGQVALVTGASSGLGARFARVLDAAGASVALLARRRDRLEQLSAELDDGLPLPCDLRSMEAITAAVQTVRERYGQIDVLVNNAGTVDAQPALEEPIDVFSDVIAVNLTAQFAVAQAVARVMVDQASGGAIVNVASILGLVGVGQIPQAGYAASKGGIVNLTRELAAQWARQGIRVNALAPGWFESEMTEEMFASEDGEKWVARRAPLGRRGREHELDGALLFLTSDASSYVTGHILAVDGGWTSV
jgi:NAD(P)-dependent dehydrogenase (short-subunit alcohol dehydrogenase family)